MLLADATRDGAVAPHVDDSLAIVEAILSKAHWPARIVYRSLLISFEWLAPLWAGWSHWGRYSKRGDAARGAYIEAIVSSPHYLRRASFKALVSPIEAGHYARPDVQLALQYDAPTLAGQYRSRA